MTEKRRHEVEDEDSITQAGGDKVTVDDNRGGADPPVILAESQGVFLFQKY